VSLSEVPLVLMLVGLAAYAVLGGADFGAGFWQLFGGESERDRAIRDHAHHAMGPVWEANHVWLIFVLVICWTAYPTAFASIVTTLSVALFVAGVGIIFRGTAYALRSATRTAREERTVERVSGVSSILTPFAFGAVIGGIASERVAVGNAKGDLVTSWLNPTSAIVGAIAVAAAAYLAAVYLAADAVRLGRPELAAAYRRRALWTAVIAGAVALGGLAVVRDDASAIWRGLKGGAGLAAVIVSLAAGLVTLALVYRSRFEAARATAAIAVAAIIAGWALAQRPEFLPGLTIDQAAAGRSTLITLLFSVGVGALLLIPSLVLLYSLLLRGRFDATVSEPPNGGVSAPPTARTWSPLATLAGACLGVGAVLLLIFDALWTQLLGGAFLVAFVLTGFVALATLVVAEEIVDDVGPSRPPTGYRGRPHDRQRAARRRTFAGRPGTRPPSRPCP
jgi:cytochrome d ubiquinol oxidase subunit II